MFFWLFVWIPCAMFAAPAVTEDEGVRRVHSHLLLEDYESAITEAQELYESFPGSRLVGAAYIEALSAGGMEGAALEAWNRLSLRYPDLIGDRQLLEELSWGVLRKGLESSQNAVRLSAMIGSYLTHDVRAVNVLLRMMRDSNAVIRSVAIQMAASFGDASLKDEIARLMTEEKIWFVRLEIIKATGMLRMKELSSQLHAILSSEKNTIEERQLAIEALVGITDEISNDELQKLIQSNRAGMRHLACQLAVHFQIKEAKGEIVRLATDSNPAVRVAALNAIALVYLNELESAEAKKIVEGALKDSNPAVAITAAYVAALIDPAFGEKAFAPFLASEYPENRRLAAAALAATGGRCVALAQRTLLESQDPYVKANVAIGLIGQRVDVKSCCDILYDFCMQEKRMWMRDNRDNPLFQVLSPSQVRHIDQIPNYPEAIDQMTRLNLVSLMALAEDPRATEALKSFLKKKSWGITGVAAAMLLQEGDQGAMDVVQELIEDPDADVRLQACLVLAMFGHDETIVLDLQKAYAQSDHDRKLHILEALGHMGNVESISFLVGVLEEPFPILRVAAASGLIQCLNH